MNFLFFVIIKLLSDMSNMVGLPMINQAKKNNITLLQTDKRMKSLKVNEK